MVITPTVGSVSVASMRSVEVLPAPLRPSSIVVWPSATPKSMPCRM